jgi:uncharacterized protein YcbX
MVHILTTATLDRLRGLYPQGRFDVRRFRPNIMVQLASGEKSFAENAWTGHTLAIGTAVRLNITGPCGRCMMTTLAQGDLPRDPGILRTALSITKSTSVRMRASCEVGRSVAAIRCAWSNTVRVRHQRENGQGARAHGPAFVGAAGGSGHRGRATRGRRHPLRPRPPP